MLFNKFNSVTASWKKAALQFGGKIATGFVSVTRQKQGKQALAGWVLSFTPLGCAGSSPHWYYCAPLKFPSMFFFSSFLSNKHHIFVFLVLYVHHKWCACIRCWELDACVLQTYCLSWHTYQIFHTLSSRILSTLVAVQAGDFSVLINKWSVCSRCNMLSYQWCCQHVITA